MPKGHNLAFWIVKLAITSLMLEAAYHGRHLKKREYNNSFRLHFKVQFFYQRSMLLRPRSTLATRFAEEVASGMKVLTSPIRLLFYH